MKSIVTISIIVFVLFVLGVSGLIWTEELVENSLIEQTKLSIAIISGGMIVLPIFAVIFIIAYRELKELIERRGGIKKEP